MRDSYFAREVSVVLAAITVRRDEQARRIADALDTIRERLTVLLEDDRTPEREWRQQVSQPLQALAEVLCELGRPVARLEHLAAEMAI